MCDDAPMEATTETSGPYAADPYDALGDLYDEWVISVTEDIAFYQALAAAAAPGATAVVVELGAGSGRVTSPLIARGHSVWGVDVATEQLARSRVRAREAGHGELMHPVTADMRELAGSVARAQLPAAGTVDLVIAPFRALLHVAADATTVFAGARELLRPGGMLAFDVFHPTSEAMDGVDGEWQLRRRLDRAAGERWAIWERATLADDGDRLTLDVRCDRLDLPTHPQRSARMLLQTPPPHHWSDALAAAGLELESVSGWFDESPFEPGMTDSVWVARRAPA